MGVIFSDLKCAYQMTYIAAYLEWTCGVKPIAFAILQTVLRLSAHARK